MPGMERMVMRGAGLCPGLLPAGEQDDKYAEKNDENSAYDY
jgi:hypothetical protein